VTKTTLFTALFTLFCLNLAAPSRLLADYYQYKDSRGVISMTNKLESVPAKYRSSMKVIHEEPKKAPAKADEAAPQAAEAASPATDQSAAATPAAEAPSGKFAELCARFPWLKPLLYIAGFFAALVAVFKVTSHIPSPLLSRLILLSFFVAVFVFMYKSYVEYMVNSSVEIKAKAVNMMKKSGTREQPLPGEEAPGAQR